MYLVTTEKADKRNRRSVQLSAIEIHPEDMTVVYVRTYDKDITVEEHMKTNFDYTLTDRSSAT